jgi:hypothetical protein
VFVQKTVIAFRGRRRRRRLDGKVGRVQCDRIVLEEVDGFTLKRRKGALLKIDLTFTVKLT